MIHDVSNKVKEPAERRHYYAPRRQAAAEQTRRTILRVAPQLFVERGYAATSIAAIATMAEVSHEKVYAAFGPKPALFLYLAESALSRTEHPRPALKRDSLRQV